MLIPEYDKGNIIAFIEKYFVEDAMPDILLEDEKVRVVYYGEKGSDFGSNHIRKKYLSFDIYVHRDELYYDNEDALKTRAQAIAQKIKEILTDRRHVRIFLLPMRTITALARRRSAMCAIISYSVI